MNFNFPDRFPKKILKFHENIFSVSRVVLCGQTEGRTGGHGETDSRFPKLYERA